MSLQRRKAFTIEEKVAIISRLENGESNSSLAKEFGVGHSTISMIFKNKNRIKQSFNANVLKPKRLRKSRRRNVDDALIQWFNTMKKKRIPISGPTLQEKANAFAAGFGILDFNCSASWISRFKVRHDIVDSRNGTPLNTCEENNTNFDLESTPNQPGSVNPALVDTPMAFPPGSIAGGSQSTVLAKRRRKDTDELVSAALAVKTPLALPSTPSRVNDKVATFVAFIGSMIREIKNEKIKIDLMALITSETFKAKALDLQSPKD